MSGFRPYIPSASEGGASNRVVVTSPSDLDGSLDSTKEYFLDGVIDLTGSGVSIEVPLGGLNIAGYSFDLSGLVCEDDNYTLFTSPLGGSGGLLGRNFYVDISGSNSKVYDLDDATGNNAVEIADVNFNNCTSLGSLDGYRQGLESGNGRFGGKPSLELVGTWSGGYFISSSIVRSLDDGAYSLFAAGLGFTMESRFRTNYNVDLPASASLLDFTPSNFTNPSTLQLIDCIISREGAFDAADSNLTPNINASDLACSWHDNTGLQNTFVGGSLEVTTETTTTITTSGVFVDLAGTYTASDLQHFDSPSNGQLRHLGASPREYKVIADFQLDSTSGDDLTLRVVKWGDSDSSFTTVFDQTREVNNFSGARDLAFFNVNVNTTLDDNDYIKMQVANVDDTSNITAEVGGYFTVEAR